MYHVPRYLQTDPQIVADFIRKNPFALLTGVSGTGMPVATHVPLLLKEEAGEFFLEGHCMKQTDHYKAFCTHQQVLAVFSGAHAYISASWYESKQQASTWNYLAAHVKGELQLLPEEALPAMLHELTSHFESAHSPAAYDQLPQTYVDKHLKAIVGFRIKVTDMQAIFKLSQNRDEKSFGQIIEQLQQSSDLQDQGMAAAMQAIQQDLFPDKG